MLKNQTAKTIFKYGLMLIYVAVFFIFFLIDEYFRFESKLTDSQINSAMEEGRSFIVWNTATYIYTALYATYILVWVKYRHIAFRTLLTLLIACNLGVIFYLAFTFQYGAVFSDRDGHKFGLEDIYIVLALFFHGHFLYRIWLKKTSQ